MTLHTIFENNSPAIQLDNISVRYRMLHNRSTTFKEHILRWMRGQNGFVDFWALKDISLSVGSGESIGIIGSNGAGKSTLLKVIAQVLHPTEGRIRVSGLVAPILSLGAGFDMELTGRENIYLNGAMLGFSRLEMNKKVPALLEFSMLKDFIDAPLRTYSSGMVARLAFAIATDVKPDILLIDEVLSVGDINFTKKCNTRMSAYKNNGTTLVIVSHSLATVSELCDRVIWLEHGTIRAVGEAAEVIKAYQQEKEQPIAGNEQVTDA